MPDYSCLLPWLFLELQFMFLNLIQKHFTNHTPAYQRVYCSYHGDYTMAVTVYTDWVLPWAMLRAVVLWSSPQSVPCSSSYHHGMLLMSLGFMCPKHVRTFLWWVNHLIYLNTSKMKSIYNIHNLCIPGIF